MTPMKADVLIVMFAYGGNGGIASIVPSIAAWLVKANTSMLKDERVGRVDMRIMSDTPITMGRNRAVKWAKEGNYDLLLMIDSDNQPDCELGIDPSAKPFWDTSFDFAYERLNKGLPSIVCAPYCGPPPHENVYVFFWEGEENSPHTGFKLEMFSRHVASQMTGIQRCSAGPTGLTLYSVGAFDLMQPPYFYYEYVDEPYQTDKASTEDVTNFRDLAINGWAKYGEPILFCNWDGWAGHHKPKLVTKPQTFAVNQVSERFAQALRNNIRSNEKIVDVNFEQPMEELPPRLQSEDSVSSGNGSVSEPESHLTSLDKTPDMTEERDYKYNTPDSAYDGVKMKRRNIMGTVVTSMGHQTDISELESLAMIVEMQANLHPERSLRCLEVGSWVGESAIAITKGFQKAGGTVYCVENFSGGTTPDPVQRAVDYAGSEQVKGLFLKNTEEFDNIRLVEEDSRVAASSMDKQDLDVVFLDAGHSYDDCKADIEAWLPHVAEDGLLVGHDYGDIWTGVIEAVNEAFVDNGVRVRQVEGTTLWVVSKQDYLEMATASATSVSASSPEKSSQTKD